MIKIKDRTFIPVLCTHGEISGKQNGESCLVIPGSNDGGVMLVQAGVPVTEMKIETPGESYSKTISLFLYTAGSSVKIFGDETAEDYYTFTDDFTFYCDAKVTVE